MRLPSLRFLLSHPVPAATFTPAAAAPIPATATTTATVVAAASAVAPTLPPSPADTRFAIRSSRASVYFILNPHRNLQNTERRFAWFVEQQQQTQTEQKEWSPGRTDRWQGVVGCCPSTTDCLQAIQQRDLLLYVGHGAGSEFLKPDQISKFGSSAKSSSVREPACGTLEGGVRSAVILMGCSSGRLQAEGDSCPNGAALSYLRGGGLTVVGDLWTVTDKDIDRFFECVLRLIHVMPSDAAASSTLSSSSFLSKHGKSSTKRRPAGVPDRLRPLDELLETERCKCVQCNSGARPFTLPEALALARRDGVCALPFLNGAAPVCYGLPVLFQP